MSSRDRVFVATLFLLIAAFGIQAPAHALGSGGGGFGDEPGANQWPSSSRLHEPPSAFVPGRYYFQKASFYLKKDDAVTAASMLRIAAAWGNKTAQYNLGVLYFHGLGGLPVDRPRGAAWLGIAAQNHGALADESLLQAWKSMSAEERRQASAITDELLPQYADAVTQRRAKLRFRADMGKVTGSHLGHTSALTVSMVGSGDGLRSQGVSFLAEQQQELDDMLRGVSGRVEVGGVQDIGVDGKAPPQDPPGGR